MFRNIRGQIASTMTWVIAFIIIFFIMFLFLIGVSSLHLNPLREKPTISLQENYRETLNDELNYQLLVFLVNHKTLISRWADDEVKLSISDLYDGKEDINMLALCKIIERDKEALGFFEFNHRKVYLIAGPLIAVIIQAVLDNFFAGSFASVIKNSYKDCCDSSKNPKK